MKLLLTILVFLKLKCMEFGWLLGKVFKVIFSIKALQFIICAIIAALIMCLGFVLLTTIIMHLGYLINLISNMADADYTFWFLSCKNSDIWMQGGIGFISIASLIFIGYDIIRIAGLSIGSFLANNWREAKKSVEKTYYL